MEHIFSIRIPPGFKITKNIGFEIPSSLELDRELYVADKPFESQPVLLGIVITSYSIHYTKLYETITQKKGRRKKQVSPLWKGDF